MNGWMERGTIVFRLSDILSGRGIVRDKLDAETAMTRLLGQPTLDWSANLIPRPRFIDIFNVNWSPYKASYILYVCDELDLPSRKRSLLRGLGQTSHGRRCRSGFDED